MKIFIVQTHLAGGGAERVGVLLAKGFADKGHQVYLVTNQNDEQYYEVSKDVSLLNLITSDRTKFHKWGIAIFNLRRHLKEQKPDVIIGIMELCSFISKIASLGLDIPVIATEHNSFERPASAPMSLIGRFMKYQMNHVYNAVTVLTESDKACIGNRLNNVFVMPNPLALMPVKESPVKEKIVLAAGRLDVWHYKGFDVLINAWGRLMKNEGLLPNSSPKGDGSLKGWRLQIAGTGSETSKSYLKRLCLENGVEDSIDFLGFVPDMESLYKKASVFVLSSRYEGFGLVLIEAMSQGCACVACDYKGRQREILGSSRVLPYEKDNHGFQFLETGICCVPDDILSLTGALYKMLTNYQYRELSSFNALKRSEFYVLGNIINKWEILINKVLS